MKKADYSKIAQYYDKSHTSSDKVIELCMGYVSKYIIGKGRPRILDIGCGTGRFSLPMARRLGFQVVGADASREMLEKARKKDKKGLVKWEQQDACKLTYSAETFDAVFMSHLLHHCDFPTDILRECWRVLVKNGVVLIRYGAMEHIIDDVEHVLFPETLTIDNERIYSIKKLEQWLWDAGFSRIVTEEFTQKTFETGWDHLNAAQMKSTSVLSMISQEAFECGIKRLEEYVNANPNDPWLLYDKFGFTVGFKD